MEHQKRMILCALYAIPQLGHCPRKARSKVLRRGCKRCLEFDDTSLSSKRRRLMFNEADVVFKVAVSSRQYEDARENSMFILGSEKNGEQNEQVSLECSPPSPGLEQGSRDCIDKKGKSILQNDVSMSTKGKGKILHEEKGLKLIEVVEPHTPSTPKQKRAKGSKTNKTEEKMLKNVAKVENAYYYTRSLNTLVTNELICGKREINQLKIDTHQQRKSIGHLTDDKSVLKSPKRKRKALQQLGPDVERETTKTWIELLSNGSAECYGSSQNKDEGMWREVLFICNVGKIQGPRVFKPWKGSVLDSVIGSFLTQRVGDNSSSSAFMSLGMAFPQDPACDLYTRHHRIMRQKRSLPTCKENVSNLGKQRRRPFHEIKKETSMKGKVHKIEKLKPEWELLRKICIGDGELERDADKVDFVDWLAVMRADVNDIAEAIKLRGMNKKLAPRIKDFLKRLVSDHGNLDLEWLRNAETEAAKTFLLSIYGFGLKSTECVQLLTLRQRAFPVDINVARLAVRLGWVFAPPEDDDILMCLLEQSSKLHELIHRYLWPRLSQINHEILYQLHCQMITLGKVFCTRQNPNCGQCPMALDCKYYNNLVDRPLTSCQEMDIEDLGQMVVTKAKPAMSIKESKIKKSKVKEAGQVAIIDGLPNDCIEAPKTPAKVPKPRCRSITVKKNIKKVRQGKNKRTQHLVYELPDWHPILETFDDRDPDDLLPYLLVTWETDLKKPEKNLAKESPSTSCVKQPRVVLGTIMIPYRTALRGKFPLNATYFQPNEVFADLQTSQTPVNVSCKTLEGIPRKTLYCGVNLTQMTKGRSSNDICELFNEGYICTRFLNRETYATKPLHGRLHESSK